MKQRISAERREGRSPMAWWENAFPLQQEMTKIFYGLPAAFAPQMNDMFSFRPMLANWWGSEFKVPNVDLVENDNSFVVKAELPGVEAKDVSVSIADRSLTVSGEKFEEKEAGDETYLCRECMSGSFSRTLALPETADLADAQASFENNVLTVTVPKKNGSGRKVRQLEVGNGRKEHDDGNGRTSSRRGRRRKPAGAYRRQTRRG